ncbi:hypothetical protein FOA52_000512 [Chlamydomonas sp. UWO 241]|nr:hypothetical protein FOA52_000512 [Chlamydomonas sp. UWO 241]
MENYFGQSQRPPPPALPKLPGYSQETGVRGGAGLAQTLTYKNGIPVVLDTAAQRVALKPHGAPTMYNWVGGPEQHALQQQQQQQQLQASGRAPLGDSTNLGATRGSQEMQWTGKKTPGWLLHRGKVLRFFSYFIEAVENSPVEDPYRVRRCEIRYFLEDDTLEVIEPEVPNSGLVQGTFLHRGKVTLADGSALHWASLRVGEPITLYGRTFHVTGADSSTRSHYADHGLQLPDDCATPEGPFEQRKRAQEARLAESTAKADAAAAERPSWEDTEMDPLSTLKGARGGPGPVFQFSKNRGKRESLADKVLRFFCWWDDAGNQDWPGQRVPLALNYYLVDNTVDIMEVHRPNDGRDPWGTLLRRCHLPKSIPPVNARPLSPMTRSKLNIQYYDWRELEIGGLVKVYGRELLLYDCDDFTRRWYKEYLGTSDAAMVALEVDFDMQPKRPVVAVPANTGRFGSEEDSMRNVLSLQPRAPCTDYHKYLTNGTVALRFDVRMALLPGQRELIISHDAARRFVLSFYPLDDTIAIFEPKRPNSGLMSGTYLERTKVWRAGTLPGVDPLTMADMQVGAVVSVFARGFELTAADERTLAHMEAHPSVYPQADPESVVVRTQAALATAGGPNALSALRTALIATDKHGAGLFDARTVAECLGFSGARVSVHEATTLVRAFGEGAHPRSVIRAERLLRVLEVGMAGVAAEAAQQQAQVQQAQAQQQAQQHAQQQAQQQAQMQQAQQQAQMLQAQQQQAYGFSRPQAGMHDRPPQQQQWQQQQQRQQQQQVPQPSHQAYSLPAPQSVTESELAYEQHMAEREQQMVHQQMLEREQQMADEEMEEQQQRQQQQMFASQAFGGPQSASPSELTYERHMEQEAQQQQQQPPPPTFQGWQQAPPSSAGYASSRRSSMPDFAPPPAPPETAQLLWGSGRGNARSAAVPGAVPSGASRAVGTQFNARSSLSMSAAANMVQSDVRMAAASRPQSAVAPHTVTAAAAANAANAAYRPPAGASVSFAAQPAAARRYLSHMTSAAAPPQSSSTTGPASPSRRPPSPSRPGSASAMRRVINPARNCSDRNFAHTAGGAVAAPLQRMLWQTTNQAPGGVYHSLAAAADARRSSR